MEIRYNVTGAKRKALAAAIGEILALEATYKGAPSFAYEVGSCTLEKDGTLIFTDEVTDSAATQLIDALKERGYEAEAADDTDSANECNELVIEVPKEGFSDAAIENLRKIIASKKTLIEKALGLYDLPFNEDFLSVEVMEDKLRFPWFTLSGADGEADAYSQFVCALCEMAKTQKRITAKERELENEKFAMRVFLIRLGFIGDEYKTARRLLLKNLTGNSSWKNGKPPEKPAAVEPEDAPCE